MYYEVDAPSALIPPLTYVFVVPTFVTSVIVAEFLSRGFVPFVSYFISSFRGLPLGKRTFRLTFQAWHSVSRLFLLIFHCV